MGLTIKVRHEAPIQELVSRHPSLQILTNRRPRDADDIRWKRRAGQVSYDVMVTFMGKTGYGKSTTVNQIVGRNIFESSDVESCTRVCQCADFPLSSDRGYYFSLVDLPGIGESIDRDREYLALYQRFMRATNVYVYLMRADQRDFTVDQIAFGNLFPSPAERERVVIGLNCTDKVEPVQRQLPFAPSPEQLANVRHKVNVIADTFGVARDQVVPYSALEGWNLSVLVERIAATLNLPVPLTVVFNI